MFFQLGENKVKERSYCYPQLRGGCREDRAKLCSEEGREKRQQTEIAIKKTVNK